MGKTLKFFLVERKMTSPLVLNAATYLTVGLIVYYFIREAMTAKGQSQKWITWLFLAVVIGFIAFLLWSNMRENKVHEDDEFFEDDVDEFPADGQKGDDINATSSDTEMEHHGIFVQDNYRKQRRNFTLADGTLTEDSQIRYADFKQWYLAPDFLQKYMEAIQEALKIKYRRLIEVRKQYLLDLKTLKSKEQDNGGLASVLQALDKSQDTKMIESTITEINTLLKDIQIKRKTLTVDVTRKGLISALTDQKHGIDSLIGREDIKDFLALQLYTFAQNPRIFFSDRKSVV